MPIKQALLSFSFLFLIQRLHAQQLYLPLHRDINRQVEFLIPVSNTVHTSFQPWLESKLPSIQKDSLFAVAPLFHKGQSRAGKLGWGLLNGHMITVSQDILQLHIDPLMDFGIGSDRSRDFTVFTNTRGIRLDGSLGKKFSFHSSYTENIASFPEYLEDYIRDTLVIPGQGRVKNFKGGGTAFDFPNASAYISYTPSAYVNIQFGHDKNFIGNGYRSVLLSDNAFRYPFLKITTSVWKLQYTNLFAEFLDIRSKATFNFGYQKKFATFQYLSLLGGSWLELGLFEGVIWEASDSTYHRGFDFNYLNPIIFLHSVQFGLGSPDNSFIGLNVNLKPFSTLRIYGQFFLDDFDFGRSRDQKGFYRNKYAFQAGAKFSKQIGSSAFHIQTEINQAWPYTYAQKIVSQNYAHYNQPLAHPLGSNFRESVSFIAWRYKRWFAEAEWMMALVGGDNDTTHSGHNIYRSDLEIPGSYDVDGNFVGTYGNFVGQGVPTDIQFAQFRLAYLVNPVTNLNVEFIYQYRNEQSSLAANTMNFVGLGLRTNLLNKYYDF